MDETEAELPTAPPDVAGLGRIDDTVWRRIVPHLRRALLDLPEEQLSPRLRQLVALPARRLGSARTRRDVQAHLAEGGDLWLALRRRLATDPDLARAVAAGLRGDRAGTPDHGPVARTAPPATPQLDRLRDRLRTAREERDDARRRAEGEGARADREAAARAELEARLGGLHQQVAALEAQVAEADQQRRDAVDRERRRGRAEVAELREQLRALRRDREDEVRRARAAEQAHAVAASRPEPSRESAAPSRLVPGRPSRLPPGVHPDTTEAAGLLLPPGRLVLVDGYNVTRTHHPALDLEGQRRWLVDLLAGAVARRRISPVVVFDGHGAAGPAGGRLDRGVQVVFTGEGVTADDDLVFQAEATDPDTPLTVVTDDGELRQRLSYLSVDLVHTRAFLGAVR